MSSDCPVLCVLLLFFHKERYAFHKDIIVLVRKFRISLWQYQAPYHVFMDPHHNQLKGSFSASCYFTSSVPLDRKIMENGSIWRVCFASKIKLNGESKLAKHYQNVTAECTLAVALMIAYLFLAGLDPWPLEPLYRNCGKCKCCTQLHKQDIFFYLWPQCGFRFVVTNRLIDRNRLYTLPIHTVTGTRLNGDDKFLVLLVQRD